MFRFPQRHHITRFGGLILIGVCPLLSMGCPSRSHNGTPPVVASTYAEQVSTFTKGTIALQSGDSNHNRPELTKFTQMAPEEPAGWANLGLLEYRAPNLTQAEAYLKKAEKLAPDSAPIQMLLGLLAESQNPQDAVHYYRKAVELAPRDLRARYALAKQLERGGDNDAAGLAGFQEQMQEILKVQPYNLVAQTELARIAAKRGDGATLKQAIALLQARSATFSQQGLQYFQALKQAAGSTNIKNAALQAAYLGHILETNIAYTTSYLALHTKALEPLGYPLEHFLKLKDPVATPAAPDTAMSFNAAPLMSASPLTNWASATWIDGDGNMALMAINEQALTLSFDAAPGANHKVALKFPGGPGVAHPGPHSVLPLDLNYDLKIDFVLAGQSGVKLYLQDDKGGFTDVTAKTTLPPAILNAAYVGAWQADIEADGDIDVVLAPVSGPPVVLRNNGDGTFGATYPFAGVRDIRDFAWVDLNGDGNPDAVMLDAQGKVHLFMNQRAGLFQERKAPASLGSAVALAVIGFDTSPRLELAVLQADGQIVRIADKGEGEEWETGELARWQAAPRDLKVGAARLLTADLDNNGGMDIIASTPTVTQVWLCDQKNSYSPLSATPLAASVNAAISLTHNGRLDLIGLDAKGQPVKLTNKGTQNYTWQEIRPHPANDEMLPQHQSNIVRQPAQTDRRSNSFGIGGEMEIRAGLLYEKQPMAGPVLHFGLGSYPQMDVLRIVWPNGDVRSEFSDDLTDATARIKPDMSVMAQHRLNTSCPFLFTWNGKEMQFVTDCIWRSPLGLKINAQDTAGVAQTEDWVKIRGDQLVPRNGVYDLRITAELWETHFFDHLSLLTVDHPAGTEIWVDERFAIPPPPHQVFVTSTLNPVKRALDDNGTDVTDILRARDGKYLDAFGRGVYRGVTRDHYVEIEMGDDVPKTGPVWLVCNGWIRPTDSSINVALGQSHYPPPQGLSLETPDANGHWSVAKPGLGFPEGKVKTILINLENIFKPGAPRKLRLRTNLEIYWDAIQWAKGLPKIPASIQHLSAQTAELQHRGFSVLKAADASSPELPVSYDQLERIDQKWRDLIGYYTRYGDVKELLEKVDDRYVIMDAGDEMRLTFTAPSAPSAGVQRDYVLVGDGWVKDGNYNTTFSKTVLPLPTHAQTAYNKPPGLLEDDPVYRLHKRDWEVYHTRYVNTDAFSQGIRPESITAKPTLETMTGRANRTDKPEIDVANRAVKHQP